MTKIEAKMEAMAVALERLSRPPPVVAKPAAHQAAPAEERAAPSPMPSNLPRVESREHSPFGTVNPLTIPRFDGKAAKLVTWLASLKRWAINLDFESVDEFFQGPRAPIRWFIDDFLVTWFDGHRDSLCSFQAFRKGICRRILGERWESILEQIYRERQQGADETVFQYAAAMEGLGRICLGEATPTTMAKMREGFCLGLRAQMMELAQAFLLVHPQSTLDDLAADLAPIEAKLNSEMARRSSMAASESKSPSTPIARSG